MDSFQKEILEEIIKNCRRGAKDVSKKDVLMLQKLLTELKELVDNSYDQSKQSNMEFWTNKGFSDVRKFRGTQTEVYPKALHLITQILDIMRGEPLMITIQKYENGVLTTYTGKESDLVLVTNTKYQQVEYDLKASIDKLKKVESVNNSYVNHFVQFSNIANEHIKKKRSYSAKTKKTSWRAKINGGHITEAFQRHIIMRHRGLINDESEIYDEDISVPEVMILLYYSLGNTGWWQQGDIGYMQVKQINNARLASLKSIATVGTKIISMFEEEHFDYDTFNRMFTQQDQEEMTDYKKLGKEKLNELIDIIYNNPNIKGVRKKDFYDIWDE